MPELTPNCVNAAAVHGEMVQCTSTKMLHAGWLPIQFCGECVYRRQPDFFTATEKLAVNQGNIYGNALNQYGAYQRNSYNPYSDMSWNNNSVSYGDQTYYEGGP